jgi:proline racemase
MPPQIRTIDAHVGGAALRLVVDGAPASAGNTMAERLEVMRTEHDDFRRALTLEPRGHAAMSGAILTAPTTPGAAAGVLFFQAGGWSEICGHGLIAAATIAVERGLMARPAGGLPLVLDTAAGPVTLRLAIDTAGGAPGRVTRVAWSGIPAFVVGAGLPMALSRRQALVDLAHAGETYAIADSEGCGVPLDPAHEPELARAARTIAEALDARAPSGRGVAGVVFTGPAGEGADLRVATVYAGGAVDRSPGGVATCAVMAVLDAMGLLTDDRPVTLESLIGTTFVGRLVGRATVDDTPAILPEIEGRAFITGEHTFRLDQDDPLAGGFAF